jgi:hypothetical protein
VGTAHVVGVTASSNFPLLSPLQATADGISDAFVTRLSNPQRVVGYRYDGLLRLISASESPGTSYNLHLRPGRQPHRGLGGRQPD